MTLPIRSISIGSRAIVRANAFFLQGFCLLVCCFILGSPEIAIAEEAEFSVPIVEDWSNLFHPDIEIRSVAIAAARTSGLETASWDLLFEKLVSPDQNVRQHLAEILINKQIEKPIDPLLDQTVQTDQSPVLLLLKSDEIEVRRLGVRAAKSIPATPQLSKQLAELVASDPDSVVQAEARLAMAEMVPAPAKQTAVDPPKELPVEVSAGEFRELFSEAPAEPETKSAPFPETAVILASASSIEPIVRQARSEVLSANASNTPQRLLVSNEPRPVPSEGVPGIATLPEPTFADEESTLLPSILDRPLMTPDDLFSNAQIDPFESMLLAYPLEAPLGFTGRSGVLPKDYQESSHFVPMADRWRSGFPAWDRYGKGHPPGDDYPYVEGNWWDPYNQNVLKGDYPLIGQHTFFRFTGQALLLNEYRQLPVATTPFESTNHPNQREFFGDPNQYFTTNYFKMSFEVFHGSAGFKPFDWAIRLTPIFNINYLNVQELGIVKPNVRNGNTRFDDFMALEEYFIEAKLADLSPDYDFISARIGSQPFTSDFRGFIFSDINRGVRLFGTRLSARDQFNLIFFDQTEKDTNSQLNTFKDRHQNTLIANYYRQDFLVPGYTGQLSMHYNRDGPSTKFDRNGFLVRPDPTGVALPHQVDAVYLGFSGEGHIGRINIANSFYWAVGRDTMNPIAGQQQDINGKMAALELSYDRDWIRFRGSFFYASGDSKPFDKHANGFDSIFDNPNFAGGQFSFWQRQQIQIFGTSLVNRFSLIPDLRSSKFQGQSNFVNPGLNLFNLGMDFELTPKLRLITNANYLQFDNTAVLEAFTFQGGIHKAIGVDLSAGLEYRPFLNDNVIIEGGYACLIPGRGFDDLYGKTEPFTTANAQNYTARTLHSAFMQMALTF